MGRDQVLFETNETAQGGIIKRHSLGRRRMHRGHALRPKTVDVMLRNVALLDQTRASRPPYCAMIRFHWQTGSWPDSSTPHAAKRATRLGCNRTPNPQCSAESCAHLVTIDSFQMNK